MVGLPLDQVERAAVALVGRGAPRGVDRIAQALRQQRQHRAVVGRGVDVVAGRDQDAAAGADPVGEHVDPLGGQRDHVGEDDDVELLELDRSGGAAPAGLDAGELLGGDHATEVPLSSRSPGRSAAEVEPRRRAHGAGSPSTMSTRTRSLRARTQRRSSIASASPDSATNARWRVRRRAARPGSAWSCARRGRPRACRARPRDRRSRATARPCSRRPRSCRPRRRTPRRGSRRPDPGRRAAR